MTELEQLEHYQDPYMRALFHLAVLERIRADTKRATVLCFAGVGSAIAGIFVHLLHAHRETARNASLTLTYTLLVFGWFYLIRGRRALRRLRKP